jgi:signal transduction histidine kinase
MILSPLTQQARQVSLLRLLLVALALAVLIFTVESRQVKLAPDTVEFARWLLIAVGIVSGILASLVSWSRHQWQLVLHLVFDLAWIGILLHLTGGVGSPAVLLLFAVVMISNLVLPGVFPFVVPSLAALVLTTTAALYLAGSSPFPKEFLEAYPGLSDTHRIIGNLAVQMAAVFVVDLLAQLLTRNLREQRLFTDELLDQLGEGVIAIDPVGTVIYLNDEARRLLHLPEGVRGQPAKNILSGEHLSLVRELAGSPQLPQISRMHGANGRQLVIRATALIGRRGRALGRTILIADETRLQVLEQNAQRAEHLAALGEMAAGIAHEVRNPLASLRGCAQELAEMSVKSHQDDAQALTAILLSESDRLARIVSDFLAFSRLREPNRGPLDLEPVFHDIERLVRLRGDLPVTLAFRMELDDETPSVLADPDQLRQILQNLIANSLDALKGRPEPAITCRAERAPDDNGLGMPAVTIQVTDNGCGIPAELHERIFTPFFSTKAQGTGLGLPLIAQIVREHEGFITLESEPGTGATFTVLLPAHSQTRSFKRALGQ